MQVPPGAEKFTFPFPSHPSSPPITPVSSQSRQSSINYLSPIFSKRNGFVGLNYSPPENIDPTGLDHHFSYAPRREISESSSESEEVEASEDENDDLKAEVESRSEVSAPLLNASVHIRHLDDQTEIQVEEMSENDMGYDTDTEAVQPDYIEDADSEIGRQHTPESEHTLADQLRGLKCVDIPGRREFEQAQRSRRERKRYRWSKGGSNKRSHAESDDDDVVEPLDANQAGSCARRLRRKTKGPDDKPRRSLLFDDPPKKLEEPKSFFDSDSTDTELSLPANRNHMNPDLEEDEHIDALTTLLPADAEDVSAPCLYPMEVDSDPSRPSSSYANIRRR